MRKLFLTGLALLAAYMARRALRRGAGDYAEIMSALWTLTSMIAATGTVNTSKAYNIEQRVNALVPRIPVPQPAPATGAGGTAAGSNSSYSTTNSSYSMGVINATANSGSSNQGGGPGSNTSGQIGGAAAHVHDMTHYHTSSADLEGVFNTLQGSYSNTIPALNALQASHSSLVPVVNNLVTDHGKLLTDHNNLKTALINANILH
jgi:hypothetical protein